MIILSILFFVTAILYASVGFGGGSTYLALLLIWNIPYHIFPIIDVPTLILVGEKDTLTPPSMALKIHKLIKNSQFSIIEEAGHLINIENPKAFNNKVLKFLKSH